MKYAIIIPDGAADLPIESLGGKTILESAKIDHLDELARRGRVGMVRTVPEGMPPGSDVAIMSVLGYDPKKYYTGRAPIEAAAQGIPLTPEEIVFRCNLVTIIDGVMADFSAGHIRTEDAHVLIDVLNKEVAGEGVKFYPGVSYRHLMVTKPAERFKNLTTTPPHDISDQKVEKYLPRGDGAEFVRDLMTKSQQILPQQELNKERQKKNEHQASSIWLWGQGVKPTMDRFKDVYGLSGAAVTAVDLVRGLATLIGWQVLHVDHATGWIDTNYSGKAKAACDALDEVDIVVVHIEGPDESGHNGDIKSKIYAMEHIDQEVVGPVLEKLRSFGDWRMLVMPDHPTPISLKTHTNKPVPFLIAGSDVEASGAEAFSETQAAKTKLSFDIGWQLMNYFIKG
jgi:2,3-bisphosphoglycerate-independent phosphoglycerate mutase